MLSVESEVCQIGGHAIEVLLFYIVRALLKLFSSYIYSFVRFKVFTVVRMMKFFGFWRHVDL
jgi:hypothetical protein